MHRRTLTVLLFILVLTACAAYIDWPSNPGLHIGWLGIHHPLQVRQGLDLQGGIRVLLVPDPVQNYNPDGKAPFTGKDLDSKKIGVGTDEQTGRPQINFAMKGEALIGFGTFTQQHVGNILTVTLDRKVIESATINGAITGPGVITGQFSSEEAQRIATVLRYGALPIALQIASQETVDPTLGEDSLAKSQLAGAIGLCIVILFMLLYYRLPGLLADLALLLYAVLTFAIFKLIGVTLTLAGIAGFVLSLGMAVDANVLIFERLKEELRAGRTLASAIDIAWKRAW